jgi:hypothetical protein
MHDECPYECCTRWYDTAAMTGRESKRLYRSAVGYRFDPLRIRYRIMRRVWRARPLPNPANVLVP